MANFTPAGIEYQVKGFSKGMSNLGKLDNAQQGLGKSSTGLAKGLTGLGGKLGTVATVAGGAALAGVGALATGIGVLGVVSVRTAISFESAFAGVTKTVDGLATATGELTERGEELKRQFGELSTEIPSTFEELSQIGELGGQLGIAESQLVSFTETVAALEVTTNLTREGAATSIARLGNIFQVETENMGENTRRVGSAIVELGNNFATTEKDILSFGERIAGAGAIAGLSQADILGIGTAFSSVGVEAEAGGTATQKVLLSMNNAVNANAQGFVDNTAAIEKNVAKMQGLNAESARLEATAPGLQQEILGQYDAFIAAGGSAEEFGRQLGDKTRQKAFETAISIRDLQQQTDLLRQSQGQPVDAGQLQKFAQVAGISADEFKKKWEEDAAGAFQMFVEGLSAEGDNAVNVLEELGLTDQRLIRSFLSVAGAGDLLGEAIETSNTAFEEGNALALEAQKRYATTESQLKMLKNTFRLLTDNIGSRFLPFFNRLIGAAKNFINKFADPISKAIDDKVIPAIEGIIKLGSDLFAAFQEGGTGGLVEALGLTPETTELIGKIVKNIKDLGMAIVGFFLPGVEQLAGGGLLDAINAAIVFMNQNFEAFKGAIIGIGAALAGAAIVASIAAIATAIGAIITPVGAIIALAGVVGAAWATNWGGIRDVVIDAWGNIQPVLQNLWVWVGKTIPKVVKFLANIWEQNLLPAITEISDAIVANIFPIFTQLWGMFQSEGPGAIQTLVDFWQSTLLPALQTVGDFILNTFLPAWTDLFVFFISLVPTVVNGIVSGFNMVVAAVNTVIGWWGTLTTTVQNFINFVSSSVITTFNTLASVLSSIVVGAINIVSAAWQGFLAPVMAVYTWISANIIPVFMAIGEIISAVVGVAITALAGLWQNVLLPPMTAVWNFIQSNLLAAFNAIAGVVTGVVSVALNALANLWNNVVLPALTAVWAFIQNSILPVFQSANEAIATTSDTAMTGLAAVINDLVMPAVQLLGDTMLWLHDTVILGLQTGLQGIENILGTITGGFTSFADTIRNVQLPEALIPGSPTPFEQGLRGIGSVLTSVLPSAIATLSEAWALAFEQIKLSTDAVNLLLIEIATVTFPLLESQAIVTASTIMSQFTQVNNILRDTDTILLQIANSFKSVEKSARSAAQAMIEGFDEGKKKLKELLPTIHAVDVAFAKLEATINRVVDAIQKARLDKAQPGVPTGQGSKGIGLRHGIGFQNGLGLGVTIPSGFPNDSFGPLYVESGEQMLVTPRGTSIDEVVLDRLSGLMGRGQEPSVTTGATINVNVGDINNGMDLAMLVNTIEQVVTEGV